MYALEAIGLYSMYEKQELIFNDLNEIYNIASSLAEKFLAPDKLTIAIYELLINAIEHGNLEIGFELKSDLLKFGLWETEINKRLKSSEYKDRKVIIEIQKDLEITTITISDQGNGFLWNQYIYKEPDCMELHGRGLMIVFNSGFDEIIFNEKGNQVKCSVFNK